jgi:hypothetical protein
MRRDNGCNAPLKQIVDKISRCVASISNQSLEIEAFQQSLRLSAIVALSNSQPQTQWITQPVHRDVDFAAKTATTASQSLLTSFFCAPAAHG